MVTYNACISKAIRTEHLHTVLLCFVLWSLTCNHSPHYWPFMGGDPVHRVQPDYSHKGPIKRLYWHYPGQGTSILTIIGVPVNCDAIPKFTLIARFMGPTWGPPGSCRPLWAPCWSHELCYLGTFWIRVIVLLIWLLHWHWGNSMIDPMSVKCPEWYGWSWPVPYHHKTKQSQNRVYNSGQVLYKNVLHDAMALTCMWSRSSAITIVTKLKLNCLCLSYDIFGINENRRRYWGPMTVTGSILWI